MADREELEAVITLVDEYTEQLGPIIQKTKEMKALMESVKPTVNAPKDKATPIYKQIIMLAKKLNKIKAKPKAALLNGAKTIKTLAKLRKEAMLTAAKSIALKIKNTSFKDIGKFGQKLKSIVQKRWDARIGVKDRASSALGKIKAMLGVLAAGVVIKSTVQSGMELEQQKVSMEHFMGVGNKDKSQAQIKGMNNDYIKQLRANANATPFETGEVIKAGTRALTISGGDTKQSMRMVKLAEDMAASDPNKSIGDAIEALADAKMGEFERLKEFGYKGTKEDFDRAGGDFFKMKSKDGQTLDGLFGGLAAAQAKTSSGMMSTIMGNIGNVKQNIGSGILDGLKPTLGKAVGLFANLGDNAGKVLGQKLGSGISKIIDGITRLSQTLDLGGIFNTVKTALEPAINLFDEFFNHIRNNTPEAQSIIKIFGTIIKTVFSAMRPVIDVAGNVIRKVMTFIAKHSRELQSIIKALGNVWSFVWGAIKTAINLAWPIIKPILSALLKTLGFIADAINLISDAWNNMLNAFKKQPEVKDPSSATYANGVPININSNASGGGRKPARGGIAYDGSAAYGKQRVPYNNYLINAHEGERVLTKQEANAYENGSSSSTNIEVHMHNVNFNNGTDADLVIDKMVKKIVLAQQGGI